MGSELGRISGPLLSANLLRNGTDLAFETDLLYLNVNTGRIGINTDGPTRDLLISEDTKTTNLIVDTQAEIADLTFNTYRIQNFIGLINIVPDQLSDPRIVTTKIATSNLNISDKLIENIVDNNDIIFQANGTGRIEFYTTNVDITGDLHATGNITFDGNVTIGDGNTDNVIFNADINSDLIPNTSNEFDLGSISQNWNNFYVTNLISTNIEADNITVNNINLLQTQGNTIYVSKNGLDSNYGTHQQSTFETVKHALSQAQAGDEVIIFPGVYEEEFPLTVPAGVTVKGFGIRAVTIVPTEPTKFNDCFLLNGETTVEFLTVKDYYYDSSNDTGYAFRFAPSFKVILRSPYIHNVTVITKEETTPVPLAAGRGAIADGSVAHPDSIQASLLFFSATFIVPNADGITATNGARVEWLNSFTYFAYRGIHLTEGTLGFANLGVKFGAEMRSINSANVYGTYGAVADGAHTLGYLIGHNFGYIGTGTNSLNDRSIVIQANEVVESNNGHIYYDSVDHKGDFRIGDVFYVNQETGQVVFDAQSIDFGAQGNITLESPSSITIIDKDKVQTGNIRVHDNNIDSLIGPVNFLAATGTTNLITDVWITGNLSVSNDVRVDGNVYLGDQPFNDTVSIVAEVVVDLLPNQNTEHNLGSDALRWKNAFLKLVDVDGVLQITTNTVSILSTDIDLKLDSLGTGIVHVTNTDVQVNNDLTTSLHSKFNSESVTNTASALTLDTGLIVINGNTITTKSNNDLTLKATTGSVVSAALNDVKVDYNVTVNGLTNLDDTDITGTIIHYGNYVQTGDRNQDGSTIVSNNVSVTETAQFIDFNITDNILSTTLTNSDLKLAANGTGIVNVKTTDVEISQNLTVGQTVTVNGLTSLKNTEIDGTVTLVGDINQTGNTNITGTFANNNISATSSTAYFTVPDIKILGNEISITAADTDLQIVANGSGSIIVDNRIKFTDNNVTNVWASATTDEQKSLILSPNGTGNAVINSSTALILPVGNNTTRTLSNFGEIRANNVTHLFEGFQDSGLVSFKDLYDSDRNTYITSELTPGANDNVIRFGINGTVRATINSTTLSTSLVHVDNVRITGNSISNLVSTNDIDLDVFGTGHVNINDTLLKVNTITNTKNTALVLQSTGIGYVKFAGNKAIVLPTGDSNDRRPLPELGEIRHNTTIGYMEVYCGDITKGDNGWIPSTGTSGAATLGMVEDIMDFWTLILG